MQLVGVPGGSGPTHRAGECHRVRARTVATVHGHTRASAGDGRWQHHDLRDGGVPWDRGQPGRSQHSDCTHTFQVSGSRTARASIDWTLRWTATDGQTGTLPAISRTADQLVVNQAQAVTD